MESFHSHEQSADEQRQQLALEALHIAGYGDRADEIITAPDGTTAAARDWPDLCRDEQGNDHSAMALKKVADTVEYRSLFGEDDEDYQASAANLSRFFARFFPDEA